MVISFSSELADFVDDQSGASPFSPDEEPLLAVWFEKPVDLDGTVKTVSMTYHMLTTTNLFSGARCPIGAIEDGWPVTPASVLIYRSPRVVQFHVDTSGDHTPIAMRSILMSIRDLFSTTGITATINRESEKGDQMITPPDHHNLSLQDVVWPMLENLGFRLL